MKFLRINGKTPIDKSDKWSLSFHDVCNDNEYGLVPLDGTVVFDVDNLKEVEVLDSILSHYNIQPLTMNTTRGKHYWFKNNGFKMGTNISTPIGVSIDTRVEKKNNYVVLKKDGIVRQWSNPMFPAVGDSSWITNEVPFWLTPLSKKIKSGLDLMEGEGRNDYFISRLITPLIQDGFNQQQVREIADIINNFVFLEPLPEEEMLKIFQNYESYSETVKVNKVWTPSDKLISDGLINKKDGEITATANNLVRELNLKHYNGGFYLPYKDMNNLYEMIRPNSDKWQDVIEFQLEKLSTDRNSRILLNRMRNNSRTEPYISQRYEVVFQNGIYNFNTGTLNQFPPNSFIDNFLPHDFMLNAYDRPLDNFLNDLFPNKEVRDLVMEFLATVLIDRKQEIHKGLLLVGSGGNGKSTFFKLLKVFFGDNKLSHLSINNLDKQFGLESLIGKSLNISDDVSIKPIKDADKLKSLTTGGTIQIDIKNKKPIDWSSECKFLGAGNQTVSVQGESGDALKRRFIFIEMKKNFKDITNDPLILDKITTPNAINYLSTLIIQGALRVLNNGFKLTEVQSVIDYTDDALESHNTSKLFIKNELDNLNSNHKGYFTADELFEKYKWFCDKENVSFSKTKTNFFKDIKTMKIIHSFRSKLFKTVDNVNPHIYILRDNHITSPIRIDMREKIIQERKKAGWE